jgi:hypothetical protein
MHEAYFIFMNFLSEKQKIMSINIVINMTVFSPQEIHTMLQQIPITYNTINIYLLPVCYICYKEKKYRKARMAKISDVVHR